MKEESLRLRERSQYLRDRNIEARNNIRSLRAKSVRATSSKAVMYQLDIRRIESGILRRDAERREICQKLQNMGFDLQTLIEHDLLA